MQYLLFLLAFIAGSLFTIGLDKLSVRRAHVRRNRELKQRELLVHKLEAEGWLRPWASIEAQGHGPWCGAGCAHYNTVHR